MIHESQIKKFYPSDTQVIRKGDRGWTSDADRQREAAATGPLTFHNGDKRPWATRAVRDHGEFLEYVGSLDHEFEVGDRYRWVEHPDHLVYEYRGEGHWRFAFRERNANL